MPHVTRKNVSDSLDTGSNKESTNRCNGDGDGDGDDDDDDAGVVVDCASSGVFVLFLLRNTDVIRLIVVNSKHP